LEFGVDLTIGPPIEEGFYYDCHMGDATLNEDDLQRVEKRVTNAIKEKQPFQRIEVSRAEALAMFQENKFKIELIENLPEVGPRCIFAFEGMYWGPRSKHKRFLPRQCRAIVPISLYLKLRSCMESLLGSTGASGKLP
jgi:threonyl-tRNA synthetase